MNRETGRKGKEERLISLNLDGVICSEPVMVVEAFANYFSTVASLSLERHYGNLRSLSCTTSRLSTFSFYFHPVTESEVINIITGLKNYKSTSVDFLSSTMLKAAREHFAKPLVHIINTSVSTGKFPSLLKTALVIPVHKRNDPSDIANYRPISMLSALSKVIEKVILGRMVNYLDKFKTITDCQHGFRPGHSTETAAVSFVEYIYDQLDRGRCVAGLFFDLSMAFDVLDFNFMRTKFYSLGFRGIFLDWLDSFITGRKMVVRVQNTCSEAFEVNSGVAQGSVLGPLLFILFINDLPNCIPWCKLILFADDSSMAVSAQSQTELALACSRLVQCFTEWCRKNALIVNAGKTDCLFFTIKNLNRAPLVIEVEQSIIKSRDCVKFLGINMDSNLRWSQHIEMLCKKLSKSYYAINQLKYCLPIRSVIDIYYSLCYSHISYNILLWGLSSDVNRVFIIQKRILRNIFGLDPRSSCRPIFVAWDLLTVPCIYIFKSLLYVRENLSKFTKLSSLHGYGTRNPEVLLLPSHRTSKFECSPSYKGTKLYNQLPNSLKSLPKAKFRNEIKKLLLAKCYYTVDEFLNDNNLKI